MSTTLILCFAWVLAGTITALFPMRIQMVIGPILLLAAPVLLVLLALEYGFWIFLIGLIRAMKK